MSASRTISGRMLLHVVDRARECGAASITVATDDERIYDRMVDAHIHVIMTSSGHASGTDRLAEVVPGRAYLRMPDAVADSVASDPAGLDADQVHEYSELMAQSQALIAGDVLDRYAMRRKHHNEATFNRYVPEGQLARDIYEAMEWARCEAVGARDMPGTASNIDHKIAHEAERRGYAQIREASEAPLAAAGPGPPSQDRMQ